MTPHPGCHLGGRPGQPISPYGLTERLHQIGIHPRTSPLHRLVQLAAEISAAILVRLLGIHIQRRRRLATSPQRRLDSLRRDISRR